MVEDGCRVCRRVQAEGMQVLSLITQDPKSLTELASAQEREKWAAAVKVTLTDSPLRSVPCRGYASQALKRGGCQAAMSCCAVLQHSLVLPVDVVCHVM